MNTRSVKTAAPESTERCGRKGKKGSVLFRMAVVSSLPVANPDMAALGNHIRRNVPASELYHVAQHISGCNMDLTLLLRIRHFEGTTATAPLGFFAGDRFLALLCVNDRGLYLERHGMLSAFAPFTQTPEFESLPGNIRAVNFYSCLDVLQRSELLNALYTRNYLEGKHAGCSKVNMRIAATIRDIQGDAICSSEETVAPFFRKIKTIFK